MKITLINPNIITQKNDFFGTGIPYMPITLAYLAAQLKLHGHEIEVIDAFGEKPMQISEINDRIIQGLTIDEIVSKIEKDTDIIFIYASQVVQHERIINIIKVLKERELKAKIIMLENSQSVVSYSLSKVKQEFFSEGIDFVIVGEPELTAVELLEELDNRLPQLRKVDGIIYRNEEKLEENRPRKHIADLETLPFPAWYMFPVKNYWELGYAHAPLRKNARYLPILTSRGCPYGCEFCVIPFINERKWRGRRADNVVAEIEDMVLRYGIKEVHIEDLNPTLQKERIEEIAKGIKSKGLKVSLKFAAGIKLETISKETLKILKSSGCDYISFSPESGSKKVLDLMKKPFDYTHGIEMTEEMHRLGITTQACFVLGFPGETKEDLKLTMKYIRKLTIAGIDEIALFMMTPIPGSKPYELSQMKPEKISEFTFSPKWRKEYKMLNRFRIKGYLYFAFLKLLSHPLKTLKQPFHLLKRDFRTKMEMTIFRIYKTHKKKN